MPSYSTIDFISGNSIHVVQRHLSTSTNSSRHHPISQWTTIFDTLRYINFLR